MKFAEEMINTGEVGGQGSTRFETGRPSMRGSEMDTPRDYEITMHVGRCSRHAMAKVCLSLVGGCSRLFKCMPVTVSVGRLAEQR